MSEGVFTRHIITCAGGSYFFLNTIDKNKKAAYMLMWWKCDGKRYIAKMYLMLLGLRQKRIVNHAKFERSKGKKGVYHEGFRS